MFHMPGRSHRGDLAPLDGDGISLRDALAAHVRVLATDIGERNLYRYDALRASASYVEGQLAEPGYRVHSQRFDVGGREVRNLEVLVPGSVPGAAIMVVGAHYDSAPGTPGANDNASGTAALIELARRLHGASPSRTVHLVAFVNEEPPWYYTADMGSLRYARKLAGDGVEVAGMLSLETIGYYRDTPKSQQYPFPFSLFYPDTGNFLGFVGNVRSRRLTRDAVRAFREHGGFPSEGAAVPGSVPGVGWSDHWSFWQQGWPALMVTDTAPFRYPHYHEPTDTAEQVDYDRLARVVEGLEAVIRKLAE
ncbi:MAG: M28 family peptidase [Deltaproteobacteria bacterium]|nr:M28 family peptidase [Deltaproteobacteria bacterium]MBW2255455.1 M28 family peptidase [Deltaproteobacteria bacterium]